MFFLLCSGPGIRRMFGLTAFHVNIASLSVSWVEMEIHLAGHRHCYSKKNIPESLNVIFPELLILKQSNISASDWD